MTKHAPQIDRPVPPHIQLATTTRALRKIAATDYICDPDGHSVRWHYERKDRPFQETVAWRVFQDWSVADEWVTRRGAYWEQIEQRVRDHMADEFLRRRLEDLEKFERRLDALDKLLEPLTEEDGSLKLDDNGMPEFALELPSMDKFMTMYLKLHERVMLLRGEATTRTEQLRGPSETAESPLNEHLRGRSEIAPKLSRQDARAMARAILQGREPALGGKADSDVIDAPLEDSENADDGDHEHEEVQQGQAAVGDEGSG